tara:strand:+ start:10317 stop:10472 length:156 start_codon:yes stop_codon:yes gene_type:complete
MVKKNIIKCSQCDAEFPGGFEYREHWEQKHFYPYLTREGFDSKRALNKKIK